MVKMYRLKYITYNVVIHSFKEFQVMLLFTYFQLGCFIYKIRFVFACQSHCRHNKPSNQSSIFAAPKNDTHFSKRTLKLIN